MKRYSTSPSIVDKVFKVVPQNFFTTSKPVFLVAGSTSFLGFFLCKKLLEKDVKVIFVAKQNSKVTEVIKELLNNENFVFLDHDITRSFRKKLGKINYIFHLSGADGLVNGKNTSLLDLETNSIGTRNLLRVAQDYKGKFLFASKISEQKTPETSGVFEKESDVDVVRFSEDLILKYSDKGLDVRIVRLGDLYGHGMDLAKKNLFSTILRSSLYKQIAVNADSHKILNPTYIDDAVESLVKSILSQGTKGKIITTAGAPISVKELTLAVDRVSRDNTFLTNLGNNRLFASQKMELEDGLRKTLSWFYQSHQQIPLVKEQGSTQNLKLNQSSFLISIKQKYLSLIFDDSKKNVLKEFRQVKKTQEDSFWFAEKKREKIGFSGYYFWLSAFFIFLFLFWYLVFPIFSAGIGLGFLYLGKENAVKVNISNAYVYAKQSEFWLDISQVGFSRWSGVPFLEKNREEAGRVVQLLIDCSLVLGNLSKLATVSEPYLNGLSLGREIDTEGIESIRSEVKNTIESINFLQASLKSQEGFSKRILVPKIQAKTEGDLDNFNKSLTGFSDLLPFLNQIVAVGEKKTYLILFQNNNELRPTGGFIGSFGLLTFTNGSITNFEVQDVYTADGQLKGHVDPPKAIKDYLEEGGWYLRDSNWSPDFPTSAARASWFLEKEIGIKVDGVIGIDLEFIKEILKETGPTILTDYGKTIDSDNLYLTAQSQSEKEFFPGSQNKKNFLTSLGENLKRSLLESTNGKGNLVLAKAVSKSVNTRHFSVWIPDLSIAKVLKVNNWDGAINKTACVSVGKSCIADYLMVVEANLGVNKSNYYLDRLYQLENTVEEKEVLHKLVINYRNSSVSGVWPGGDYKNYLRIYIPQGGSLLNFTVARSREQILNKVVVEQSKEFGKEVFGGLVIVPSGEERVVEITWQTKILTPLSQDGSYIFDWQKQMGTLNDPVSIVLNLPIVNKFSTLNRKISYYPESLLTVGGGLRYNTDLRHDLKISASWNK